MKWHLWGKPVQVLDEAFYALPIAEQRARLRLPPGENPPRPPWITRPPAVIVTPVGSTEDSALCSFLDTNDALRLPSEDQLRFIIRALQNKETVFWFGKKGHFVFVEESK